MLNSIQIDIKICKKMDTEVIDLLYNCDIEWDAKM